MGKPRMIILIRHAQSEGNKNRDIHQHTPDHRVKLTPEGWRQAREAGHRLRKLLLPTDTLHFFTSPYTRTRQTTEGILSTLCTPESTEACGPTQDHTSSSRAASPPPSSPPSISTDAPPTSSQPTPTNPSSTSTLTFCRASIRVYDDPRLREQDFGNYQPCSSAMSRMWAERASYGHFFYRIANGESAADAYDRISGFNESLWRSFSERDCASVVVLVTHGLMARVFLMKWYHYSVEHFEDLRNVEHCEFVVMEREDSGRYALRNKLRTWSELKKREREEGNGDEEEDEAVKVWGGCPDGCDHAKDKEEGEEVKRPQLHKGEGSRFYPPEHSEDPAASESKRLKTDAHEGKDLSSLPIPARPATMGRKSTLRPGRDAGGSESGVSSDMEDASVSGRSGVKRVGAVAVQPGLVNEGEPQDHTRETVRTDALGDVEHAEEEAERQSDDR